MNQIDVICETHVTVAVNKYATNLTDVHNVWSFQNNKLSLQQQRRCHQLVDIDVEIASAGVWAYPSIPASYIYCTNTNF